MTDTIELTMLKSRNIPGYGDRIQGQDYTFPIDVGMQLIEQGIAAQKPKRAAPAAKKTTSKRSIPDLDGDDES